MSSLPLRATVLVLAFGLGSTAVALQDAKPPAPDAPKDAPAPKDDAKPAPADGAKDGAKDGAAAADEKEDAKDAAAGASLAADPAIAQQVDQFLHYILIARPDLAATAGEALVADSVPDARLAETVDGMHLGEKLDRAMQRGRAMSGGVDVLVGKFTAKLERGRLALARQTKRMQEAIEMLGGTIRQQGLARRRLTEAGEYAVPLLLNVIVEGRSPKTEVAATEVLVEIRRRAVLPLAAALPDLDPTSQRKVSDILAQIGWPTAVPALQGVAAQTTAPQQTRDAANRAVARLGGPRGSVSDALASLAKDFFLRRLPLIPYPEDPVNNIWVWDTYAGLTPTPVPTPIFWDVMAMRLAEQALKADPANSSALAVFVAANLSRENNLPEGGKDPVYGAQSRSPQFYATAVGSSVGQQVLSLALDTKDTALVRDAIEALAQTGGAAVVMGANGRTPIIECLAYPDRRVQYDAAIMLGNAMPTARFAQDTAVVPLLASAARSAGVKFAAVVAADAEDQRQLASALTSRGFTVVGSAAAWNDLVASAQIGGLLDLVAIRGRSDQLQEAVLGVRGTSATAAAPVLIVVAEEDRSTVQRLFNEDRRVALWNAGAPEETLDNTINDFLSRTTGGPIDEAEAIGYAMRSLEALEGVAISRSPAFRIEDAERILAEALDSRSGAVRLAVAEVVALIPTDTAQRKLIDVTLAAGANPDEQAELLARVAASGRRNGNRAEARQIQSLRDLVQKSTGTLADAAANAYGALGLPAQEAVNLIVGAPKG